MPLRFLHDVSGLKMMSAGIVAMLSTLADAGMEAPGSWESMGLKTALIAAIIYLVRELGRQRDAATAEAVKREDKLIAVIEANTLAKQELKTATDLQTSYYKTVAHTLLSRELKPNLPP